MSDTDVSFSGQTVSVAGQTWQAPWPVKEALVIDGRVILLYDYMAGPRHRQFRNLEAFSFSGERLWTAEHPTSETADAYVEFMSTTPLVVWDFACYRCIIDPSSGRLIESQFTK